jgi:glycosyltransferase involved in cell wall biosynthesis
VLAATGRLAWQKGFDILIEAYASIAHRHPEWTLVIWGEGELRADLEDRVRKLGLGDRIRLPGNSRSPEAWISGADAFVMSSRYEGFGNALGEAMAAGLPAVSFACDYGPTEIIEPEVDGILVPRIEAPALARELDRLLSDAGLRERLGAAALLSTRRFHPARIFREWDLLRADLTAGEAGADELVRGAPAGAA